MLNKKARRLIGYESIVSRLADTFPDEKLDYLETEDILCLLGEGYESWEFKDWCRLINDIKKRKRQAMHDEQTAEIIFNGMPWASQQSLQTAVTVLIKKAAEEKLFRLDETADTVTGILWEVFYCTKMDIKKTAVAMSIKNKSYSRTEMNESLLLLDFIQNLRKTEWFGSGEVLRLREM